MEAQPDQFDLKAFHARIEVNGNLPFAVQQHDAGIGPSLDPAFVNLFSAFDGVSPRDIPAMAAAPELVQAMHGAPAGARAVQLSGYHTYLCLVVGSRSAPRFLFIWRCPLIGVPPVHRAHNITHGAVSDFHWIDSCNTGIDFHWIDSYCAGYAR